MSSSETSKSALAARLQRFSRVRRGLLNARLAYRLGLIAASAGSVGLVALNGWIANAWIVVSLAAALLLSLLGLGIAFLVRRARFRSALNEAFHIEAMAGGDLKSRLISAWDFQDQNLDTPLIAAVIAQAGQDLEQPWEDRLPREGRNQWRKRFTLALVVFLALGCTPWFGFTRVGANVYRSCFAIYDSLFPVEYDVQPAPGRHVIQLGAKVDLGLRFKRHTGFTQVTLVRTQGDQVQRQTLPVAADRWARATVTSDVETELSYCFEFGTRQSPPIQLVFTARPVLVNMQTELIYPAYTRMLPRTLEGIQPRIVSLAGTRLTLGFTFSKALESAVITWDDGETLPLETVGRFASTSLMHNRDRRASLQVTDNYGLTLEYPLVIDFETQKDEPPQVVLPRHLVDDMPMLKEGVDLFGFGVRAQDDFGVTRCVLKWQKTSVTDPSTIRERGEVERLISPAQRKAVVSFEKVFAGMNLTPGDKITFLVEAADNRTPDAQVTRSRPASLFVYQESLGDLSIRELGFGGGLRGAQSRIPKSRRATSVKEPDALRTHEQVRNEFASALETPTQAPLVRGEYGQPTRDYFRLLSTVVYDKKDASPSGKPEAETKPEGIPQPTPQP